MFRFGIKNFAGVLLLAAAFPVQASFSSVADRTALHALPNQSFTLIDFNTFVGNGYNNAAGLATSGITFVGQGASGNCTGGYDLLVNTSGVLTTAATNTCFKITIQAAGVRSVGFDISLSSVSANVPFDVQATGGNGMSPNVLVGTTAGFWGISSTTDITSITITGVGSNMLRLDNFEFGTDTGSTSAPEALTMVLIGSGLIFLRGLRYWQHLVATAIKLR